MAVNSVCISGNLTRDPELRSTAGGLQVLSFSVAVNERRQNRQTGEWEDYANYIDCSLFGKRAAALEPYLRKGEKVAVQGSLRYSSWEAKDGSKRSRVSVVVKELELMGRTAKQEAKKTIQDMYPGTEVTEVYSDENIPF